MKACAGDTLHNLLNAHLLERPRATQAKHRRKQSRARCPIPQSLYFDYEDSNEKINKKSTLSCAKSARPTRKRSLVAVHTFKNISSDSVFFFHFVKALLYAPRAPKLQSVDLSGSLAFLKLGQCRCHCCKKCFFAAAEPMPATKRTSVFKRAAVVSRFQTRAGSAR